MGARMNDVATVAEPQRAARQTGIEQIGLGFVQAYNDRDLEAMLALTHPEVIGNPSRALGGGTYEGHDGLRGWWKDMDRRGAWYSLRVSSATLVERRSDDRRGARAGANRSQARAAEFRSAERRQIAAAKLAVFGEICIDDEPLAPWAAVFIVRGSLIIRHRSYLSSRSLLEEIGIVSGPDQPA